MEYVTIAGWGVTRYIGGDIMARLATRTVLGNLKASLLHDYKHALLMAVSAVVLSAATIIYYNHKMYYEQIANVYSTLELISITLMPYMISDNWISVIIRNIFKWPYPVTGLKRKMDMQMTMRPKYISHNPS